MSANYLLEIDNNNNEHSGKYNQYGRPYYFTYSRPHIMRGSCQNKQAYIRFIIIITMYVHNIYIGYNNYVSVIILKLAITVIALLSTIIRKLND